MILEYPSTLEWIQAATQTREVDRLMFPNYIDFLLFVKDETYKAILDGKFVLTNAMKHPFQIGLAFAVDGGNMTFAEEAFVMCMKFSLPTLERQV